jgi:hypothetical protein
MKADTTGARISAARPTLVQQPDKAKWIAENLKAGEVYAGILLGENGAPDHHLLLLPSRDNKKFTWQQAMDAAQAAGGALPTRREQSLLFANAKAEFQPTWYWSCEQHASEPSYAWTQLFSNGLQYSLHQSYEGRARAVRRLPI